MTKDTLRSFFARDDVLLGKKSDTKEKLYLQALSAMQEHPELYVKFRRRYQHDVGVSDTPLYLRVHRLSMIESGRTISVVLALFLLQLQPLVRLLVSWQLKKQISRRQRTRAERQV